MNRHPSRALAAIAGVLGAAEFAAAFMISFPWGAAIVGALFVVGALLLWRGVEVAGTILVAVLCTFVVVMFPGLSRDGALDWFGQVSLTVLAAAGLAIAVASLVGQLRLSRAHS